MRRVQLQSGSVTILHGVQSGIALRRQECVHQGLHLCCHAVGGQGGADGGSVPLPRPRATERRDRCPGPRATARNTGTGQVGRRDAVAGSALHHPRGQRVPVPQGRAAARRRDGALGVFLREMDDRSAELDRLADLSTDIILRQRQVRARHALPRRGLQRAHAANARAAHRRHRLVAYRLIHA